MKQFHLRETRVFRCSCRVPINGKLARNKPSFFRIPSIPSDGVPPIPQHVAAASGNAIMVEWQGGIEDTEDGRRSDIEPADLLFTDDSYLKLDKGTGRLIMPQEQGLGIERDMDKCAKYLVRKWP